MAVVQLEKEPIFSPGTKVRIISGKGKEQRGIVADSEPQSSYQKSRICVQLPRDLKWFQPRQLEVIEEENNSVSTEAAQEIQEVIENAPGAAIERVEEISEPQPEPEVSYQWLNPGEIELEEGTQSRVNTDERAYARYAEEMRENRWDWQHSPPVIFDDGTKKRPGDGHHRIRAAALAEEQIFCEVRTGTKIDAIRYSCSSNQRPSLHRTNADKRQAVEMMFQTLIEEFGSLEAIPRSQGGKRNGVDWSNRRIAEYVGVSRRTVDSIYGELELTGQIAQFEEGLRVEIIEADNLPEWAVAGMLGTVKALDKKLGLWVSWDNSIPRYIHPDFVVKTDLPFPNDGSVSTNTLPEPQSEETPALLNGHNQLLTSVEEEIQQKAASVGLNGKGKQVLPDVPRNEPPASISLSEEFSTTVPIQPESVSDLEQDAKRIANLTVNNAKHFSRSDLLNILSALVKEHGLDA